MPEIVIVPGLRDVGNGPSEQQQQMRQDLVKHEKIRLWAHAGTEQECEEAWKEFLLESAADCRILNYEDAG